METKRQQKFARVIQKELSEILQKAKGYTAYSRCHGINISTNSVLPLWKELRDCLVRSIK